MKNATGKHKYIC